MERARYQEHLQSFSARLLADGKSRNTVASYTRDVGEFLEWLASHDSPRVDHITEEQIAGFIAALAARELGERSKAKKLTSIRSFLVWARREALVESYPRKLTFAKIKSVIAARRAQRIAAQA
jgi:site-specific recombinase XerD